MQLLTKSIAAISGVSVAIAGVATVAYLSSPSNTDPLQSSDQTGWQLSMHRGRMPMHQGQWQGQHGQMMHMMQANNEFEFLSLMIPHHQEAIATAQRVLECSERSEMRAFAQDIIDVQTAEVEQMQAWLNEWYPGQETSLTYSPMMRDLSQLEGNALDQAFLEDMVMHHMEAVMMSQRLINHGLVEHQDVQPFAQNIANTQRQEIWQMQSWLQDWYEVGWMSGWMHQGQR